ncbi:RagB/SusD family nutrient uptake outer membrane protein [Psychroflexus sp. YR1-1]|uniref:RagB/SusD family nutrient uptake outer membrane protein n=2 Tax=Psychroflexus aurantiacus TaxID=2709310 RepID=A0A6B3R288_9FLAO|nr:RagB/SusD family nutrient uptake outer membrane protein [Psychroflexus aurantiacus]
MKFSFVAFLLVGCEEEFLVEEPTGSTRNIRQIGEAGEVNPEINGAFMTGVYSTMFSSGTGGTGSHTDFGQRGYDVYGDMLSGDMALSLSTYGWYRAAITEFQAPEDFTQQENYQVWRYYYRVINRSNLVIESILGQPQPETEAETMAIIDELTDNNRHIVAQAFAMRAHSYFYLTQYLVNDVTASWTSPTLPIYTRAGITGNAKSTTEEVYNVIEADLNRAIPLLGDYSRPSKLEIDQSVAQTILAYVLASRKDRWSEVVTLTNDALAGTSASLMDTSTSINGIRGGFNNVGSQGWMWGVDLNEAIGVGLVSWWGQIDLFSYSYAAVGDNKAMDESLYNSMDANDARRGQYLNNPNSSRYLQPFNKFYDSDRVVFGSSQIVKADYVFMRYAEVLLLNIEALAKSGSPAAAKTKLEDFVAARGIDPAYVAALNGQVLLDEIYKQIRLELWGEGKSYLAMKRNEATTVRGTNHLSFVGVPIPYNDERMTFEIPLQEIQDNNEISDQN